MSMWDDEAGYSRDDPKHPGWAESRAERADNDRKAAKENAPDSRFAIGDRIRYVNFSDDDPGGVVTAVTSDGYRIKWDDGYKDEAGATGCYLEHELFAEEEA